MDLLKQKSASFINGLCAVKPELNKLLEYVKIIEVKLDSTSLSGKKICITGTLSQPRKQIQSLIESNGGSLSSSVSAKLDYLVCGADAGSKEAKAKKRRSKK